MQACCLQHLLCRRIGDSYRPGKSERDVGLSTTRDRNGHQYMQTSAIHATPYIAACQTLLHVSSTLCYLCTPHDVRQVCAYSTFTLG